MANFPRVKLSGYAANEKLTSAQMNALDIDHTKAPNFADGSDHTPAAPVYVRGAQGLYCETLAVDGAMTTHSGTTIFLDTTGVEFFGNSLCTFDDDAQLSFLDGSAIGLADGCVFVSAATLTFAGQSDQAPCIDDTTVPTASHRKETVRAKITSTVCGHLIASRADDAMVLSVNAGVDDTTGEYMKDANDTAGALIVKKSGEVTAARKATGSSDFTTFDRTISLNPQDPAGTPDPTTVYPANVLKARASVSVASGGTPTLGSNFGLSSVVQGAPAGVLHCTLANAMLSTSYEVQVTSRTAAHPLAIAENLTTTTFDIRFLDSSHTLDPTDDAGFNATVMITVTGDQ